jgi:hypothetical protein
MSAASRHAQLELVRRYARMLRSAPAEALRAQHAHRAATEPRADNRSSSDGVRETRALRRKELSE